MKAAVGVRNWAVVAAAASWLAVTLISAANGQLLLRDDFDDTGNVDTTIWRLPFGDSEGTFVGRTQFRGDTATDVPQQGVAEPLAVDGKVMEIHLDTFSPVDPGNQFLGTDVLTKRNFARGGGLTFEARMRLKPTTVGGLVDGFFLFDTTRENPPGTLVRDEIDVELLSNQATGAATNDPFTNVWNDEPFSDPGDGQFVDVAGLDLTQFHDYKVEWTPQQIRWFVDNGLVRTQTTNVPDDPMNLHFNLWAPNSDFADAFNAALQPVGTAEANQRYSVQVDHVEVNRINTTASGNLLTDGSFETAAPVFIGSVPATTTGQWLSFGNVFRELDDELMTDPGVPDAAVDGIFMLKSFGPFFALPNASGVVQNVAASPGQEFEARAWVQTAAGDSILGRENFNTLQISFMNAAGAVIESAPFVPVNGGVFPLLDGRDPNAQEDVWVEGVANAIAPPGTAFVRVSLFFIQLARVQGDYNGNGVVDAADYTAWRDTLGQNVVQGNGADGDDGTMMGTPDGVVDVNDYLWWKAKFGQPPVIFGDGGASWFDNVSLVRLTPSAAGAGSIAAAVPEPSMMAATILGLLAELIWRRSAAR